MPSNLAQEVPPQHSLSLSKRFLHYNHSLQKVVHWTFFNSAMITSFFKPKAAQKVTPEPSCDVFSSSIIMDKKRSIDDSDCNEVSNKRTKNENETSVRELISYLHVPNCVDEGAEAKHTTWKDALENHFATPAFTRLANFVASQRYDSTI